MSESLPCRSTQELVGLVSALRRIGYQGHLLLLCNGDDNLAAAIEHDGDEDAVMRDAVALLGDVPDGYGLAIVTERSEPTVAPGDELRWEELASLARASDTRLLQWLVVAGERAASVALHTPSPPALPVG